MLLLYYVFGGSIMLYYNICVIIVSISTPISKFSPDEMYQMSCYEYTCIPDLYETLDKSLTKSRVLNVFCKKLNIYFKRFFYLDISTLNVI